MNCGRLMTKLMAMDDNRSGGPYPIIEEAKPDELENFDVSSERIVMSIYDPK